MDPLQREAQPPKPAQKPEMAVDLPATRYVREIVTSNFRAIPREVRTTLTALFRQGLKDLQNVVLNPFPDHVAQHEEPGTPANPTQLEVYQLRHQEKREMLRVEPMVVREKELERG